MLKIIGPIGKNYNVKKVLKSAPTPLEIKVIHRPIGLFPSRQSRSLAVSDLAEQIILTTDDDVHSDYRYGKDARGHNQYVNEAFSHSDVREWITPNRHNARSD